MPSGDLSDTLAQIAAKSVLKKTLLDKKEAAYERLPLLPGTFPLTASSGEKYPLVYRSAIALEQVALSTIDAEALAQQWVEVLMERDDLAGAAPPAIAIPWIVDADAQGWLVISLTDAWISRWLQVLHSRSRVYLAGMRNTDSSLASPDLGTVLHTLSRRPLCTQLALSLPMLLQFTHACCCYWLSERCASGPPTQNSIGDSPVVEAPEISGEWSSQSPGACHELLRAIAQALDIMAEQRGDRATCLRQGYRLAEAVYTFQAAIPLATVPTFGPEIQTSIWSIVRAAQQGLALVILGILKQTPAQQF
ncbi:MAG: hypothetical protein AAFQ89_11640 [Cyanobacteria bacterium J06626_18]